MVPWDPGALLGGLELCESRGSPEQLMLSWAQLGQLPPLQGFQFSFQKEVWISDNDKN